MKKYLVVGGFGFIGHRVTRELCELGHEVQVLDLCKPYQGTGETQVPYDRRTISRKSMLRGVPIHRVDITDQLAVEELISHTRPDVLIHLASVPITGLAAKNPVWSANQMVLGTTHLLESSQAAGVERFVYVSSSMVYGEFQSDPAPESHPTECRTVYGNLKLACERLAIAYQDRSSMESVIVRPMSVYGPTGNEDFVITKFVRAALEGRTLTLFGADTSLDFTYVDDTAHGIVLAALSKQASGEVFNVAAGNPRRLVEAVEILEKLVGSVKYEVLPVKGDYPRRGGLDISKARSVLGFEAKSSLEDGLGGMIDAFARNGSGSIPTPGSMLSRASG